MEIWEVIKNIGSFILLPLFGLVGYVWKKIDLHNIRIAVLETQIVDTKDDVREIKKSIDSLEKTIKDNFISLNSDIKQLMRK